MIKNTTKEIIFLDKASTTTFDVKILDYIKQNYSNLIGNPSSIHKLGQMSRSFLESHRRKICAILNISSSQLIFNSGSTEGNNTIIHQNFDGYVSINTIHSSIWKLLNLRFLDKTTWCNHNKGLIDIDHIITLSNKLKDKQILWIFSHVNSETGVIQNIHKIIEIIKNNHRHYVLIDETQAMCKLKVLGYHFNADYCTFSGHKFRSIKGIGGVILSRNIEQWKSMMLGGEQEFGKRGGTENIIGISSLYLAINDKHKNWNINTEYIKKLDEYFLLEINKRHLKILSFEHKRMCGIFNINYSNMSNVRNDLLCIKFSEQNICISTGSACSSGNLRPNRIINNILRTNNFRQHIRVSFDETNTLQELSYFWEIFDKII